MNWNALDITINGLQRHYQAGDFSPRELILHLIEKSERYCDHHIWIQRLNMDELEPYLNAIETQPALPLYGVPFAIKDNIDLAGVDTTAACEAFRYRATEHALVVKRLIDAGAIPLGKTNLDQFATGLVGTRSPFGVCKNAFDKRYISGGSSAGSAVAVALGLVSFALGTDTAGSGRVPAALNNLYGLKPSKGLLSTRGVVPACRTLDTVSIFSLNADDAGTVFDQACAYDEEDSYARINPFHNSRRVSGVARGRVKIGVPHAGQREFYGDENSRAQFDACLARWRTLGAEIIPIDLQPFLDAASLLYNGPWLAERAVATETLLSESSQALHPVVRGIIERSQSMSAADGFKGQYQLQTLKKRCDAIVAEVDFLLTPTIGHAPTIEAIENDPIGGNSRLGYYTNFMNLLDYAAIAIPYEPGDSPTPLGFTLCAPAFSDQKLLAWARFWQTQSSAMLGNTGLRYTPVQGATFVDQDMINVVVCGAHLEGQPLNWQLRERGASLVARTQSAPHYRLYALADGKRPGMVRDTNNGVAIEVEVWCMPAENFGSFVAAIPAPLGVGKVELDDGRWESGFICDHYGLEGAADISGFGGWRAYLARP